MSALSRYALLVIAAFAAPALAGCTMGDGTTPTCTDDVGSNGKPVASQNEEGGCNRYATCTDSTGKAADPRAVCCKDLTSFELSTCLAGYGIGVSADDGAGGGA